MSYLSADPPKLPHNGRFRGAGSMIVDFLMLFVVYVAMVACSVQLITWVMGLK